VRHKSCTRQHASVTTVQYSSCFSSPTTVVLGTATLGIASMLFNYAYRSMLPNLGHEMQTEGLGFADEWRVADGMRCEIHELSGRDMSAQFAEHRRQSQPVRLLNATAEWQHPAWVEPVEFQHLLADAGCCVTLRGVTGGGVPSDSRLNFSRELWDELGKNRSNSIFNVDYSPVYWATKGFYSIPRIFRSIRKNPILSLGSHGSGIFAHQHDENFLTQVQGTKVWFVAPPEVDKLPIRHPCTYIAQRPPGVLMCAVRPGETIYVPDRWHHATCNLGGEGAWGQRNLAVGGQGDSKSWPESFHALADGDMGRLLEAIRKTLSSLSEARRACAKCGGAFLRQLVALLHFAARSGNLAGIGVVLDEVGMPGNAQVVDVDARDPVGGYGQIQGGTALHVAAWYGHLSLVQELVRRGADVGAELQKSDGSLRASALARRQGHHTTAMFLTAEEPRS